MKFLFPLFALGSSVFAEINERSYVDNTDFLLSEGSDNWNDDFAAALSEDISTGTDLFFSTYFTDDFSRKYLKFGERAKAALNRTIENLHQRDQSCMRAPEIEGIKETSVEIKRWNLPTSNFITSWKSLYYQYGRLIKEQIYWSCPRRAMVLLKRIDRFKLIMIYKYCQETDDSSVQCTNKYPLSADSSEVAPLKEMPHPRTWVSNIYGRHKELEFSEDICADEIQQISCPLQHQISIQSASFGRALGRPCGGGRFCNSSFDLTEALKTCNGDENCAFDVDSQTGNFTDCEGKNPYLTVNFKCL